MSNSKQILDFFINFVFYMWEWKNFLIQLLKKCEEK